MATVEVDEKLKYLGSSPCIIRETFEYGLELKKKIGEENVYDFSLGNPNVLTPEGFNDTYTTLLKTKSDIFLHGYTSARGDEACREAIVKDLNARYNCNYSKDDLFVTCGAAPALTFVLRAFSTKKEDEIILLAPFFPEYITFSMGGQNTIKICKSDTENFQINFKELEAKITKNTKIIVTNSPNNPTGMVYTEETIKRLAELLNKKQTEFNKAIFILSDETYRELIYDNMKYPFTSNYYDNTIICYSFSKSMAIPGERIGYVLVGSKVQGQKDILSTIAGAGRIYGHACAPSLIQKVITKKVGNFSDLNAYEKNREDLYGGLCKLGYSCIKPQGAFYLFMKALEEDSVTFCQNARKFNILIIPADSFGCKGYVRIAFCVKNDMIHRSMTAFKTLKEFYDNLKKKN